jgi:dTDP-4-dehydrorhamnose reductase
MLACALAPALEARGHTVVSLSRRELDVTDADGVRARLRAERPDAVVQCAAYTAVDEAESDETGAFRVNAGGAEIVAVACHEVGARFVYPSTDYVFAGTGSTPYRPDDEPTPVNAYGRSKLAGERAARRAADWLVVRTSWLYGAGGGNFVSTITRLGRERARLEVVDDQIGRPTWTGTLAEAVAALLEREAGGIHHVTDGGTPVSWYGFAREVVRSLGLSVELQPVTTGHGRRREARPGYSVLDCSATERLIGPLPDWHVSLERHLLSGGTAVASGCDA